VRRFWVAAERGDWFGVPAPELGNGRLGWIRDNQEGNWGSIHPAVAMQQLGGSLAALLGCTRSAVPAHMVDGEGCGRWTAEQGEREAQLFGEHLKRPSGARFAVDREAPERGAADEDCLGA
jgi:hypothetical protein